MICMRALQEGFLCCISWLQKLSGVPSESQHTSSWHQSTQPHRKLNLHPFIVPHSYCPHANTH